jgi:hypothetical protein
MPSLCGARPRSALLRSRQVINRDLSILAIKVFDRWRKRDVKRRELRAEFYRRNGSAAEAPDDLQVGFLLVMLMLVMLLLLMLLW